MHKFILQKGVQFLYMKSPINFKYSNIQFQISPHGLKITVYNLPTFKRYDQGLYLLYLRQQNNADGIFRNAIDCL